MLGIAFGWATAQLREGDSCEGMTDGCNYLLGLMCSPGLTSVSLAAEPVVTAQLCLTQRSCDALAADAAAWRYSPQGGQPETLGKLF